ncbi:MAG: DUF975 family protein [Clostridia bacterium]|nr:DUF975 family protein [Clostridia bacterium]
MNRAELKSKAKSAFLSRYWLMVGLTALMALLTCFGGISFSRVFGYDRLGFESMSSFKNVFSLFSKSAWKEFGSSFTFGSAFGLAAWILAVNVFAAGYARICLKVFRGESASLSDLLWGFSGDRYWRIVGAMALYELFVTLGFMCFAVPGIIAAVGLSQVPFVLSEADDGRTTLAPMAAIRASWELMRGHKWERFVLGLSFLGWRLLSALTFGLLGILFVEPYARVTFAGYFDRRMQA